MADVGDFMCGTYTHIYPLYMPLKEMGHMKCTQCGRDICSDTFMVTACEVDTAVSCILADTFSNVRFICSHRMRAVWPILAMWQLYVFSDMATTWKVACKECGQCSWSHGWCYWLVYSPIFIYIPHAYPWKICHTWHFYEMWWTCFILAYHNALFSKLSW